MLAELEESLPHLLVDLPREQRLGVLAAEASFISDAADPKDWPHVQHRIFALADGYGLKSDESGNFVHTTLIH
jgi:hypothetical protein